MNSMSHSLQAMRILSALFRHPTLLKLAVGWQAPQICFFTSCFQVGITLTGCIHLFCTAARSRIGVLLMSPAGLGN